MQYKHKDIIAFETTAWIEDDDGDDVEDTITEYGIVIQHDGLKLWAIFADSISEVKRRFEKYKDEPIVNLMSKGIISYIFPKDKDITLLSKKQRNLPDWF
jgi:hypothetical protein